jgi:hypothetical protein
VQPGTELEAELSDRLADRSLCGSNAAGFSICWTVYWGEAVSKEQERPDADIPQDPGIPGPKVPDEVPPKETPHVDEVPDSGYPDSDNEGHMTREQVDQRAGRSGQR